MTHRKKLIEVALPLAAINAASAREKSIRHGHPSTLHLWWARRPLAACRAVLFASLVNDPGDDPMYKASEEIAAAERSRLFDLIEELVLWENSNNPRVINAARAEIARSIAANKIADGEWKNETILDFGSGILDGGASPTPERGPAQPAPARDFVHKLASPQQVNAFLAAYAPPVLDPFCGGGSIPLEAQRLGLRAYGSDLNPVAVLITKALVEIPPKFAGRPPVNPAWQKKKASEKAASTWRGAEGLAEDVRYYGQWMRDEAEKRIGHLYPKVKITKEMATDRPDLRPYVGQELTVIAWLWARTVASPNPACNGAHVPLVRSYWLSTKKGKEAYAEPVIDRTNSSFRFVVKTGNPQDGFEPGKGTVNRLGGRCTFTNDPMPFPHIRQEGQQGRMRQRLMAIVAEGSRSRVYLSPIDSHVETAISAKPIWRPDATLPDNPRDFKTPNYGMNSFADLFTPRQLVALTTFSDLVGEARERVLADAKGVWGEAEGAGAPSPADSDLLAPLADGGLGPTAYADAVATYLAFSVDRSADFWCSLCTWANQPKNELVAHVFGRQALPMVWDFAEANPFSDSGGNFSKNHGFVIKALGMLPNDVALGLAEQIDAALERTHGSRVAVSTDPPYYDNIGYADLSDFFYVWLRRSLRKRFPTLCATALTPKAQELIASPYRHDGKSDEAKNFFEVGLRKAFSRIVVNQHDEVPATVYYGFKQSEDEEEPNADDSAPRAASTGWETMLSGLFDSGFAITGTWPVRSERPTGMKGTVNALASSIVLVCRPRPENAPPAARKEFLAALKRELPEALKNLQQGNIAPVDLAQAAIGPGMAVFTRYSKVMETSGAPMTVRTALGIINQVLDEVLAEQEGEFDSDTRWALAWFEQFGTAEGPFGVAETLSKAKNTSVGGLVEAGVVQAKSGKVKLVARGELPSGWDPAADKRRTVWETTQHLIRRLNDEGESAAAALLVRLGGMGEIARDLAYRLYSICERKKWAEEALAYNGLVIAWPELTKLATAARGQSAATQQEMEF